MAGNALPALLRLKDAGPIAESELRQATLSVHLTSDPKLRTAWPSEITIVNDQQRPPGEAWLVDLKIEAKPFSDYVTSWRPELYVCVNRQVIGYLRLK